MSEQAAAVMESLCSMGLPLLQGAIDQSKPQQPEFLISMAVASCISLPGNAASKVCFSSTYLHSPPQLVLLSSRHYDLILL